MLTKSRTVLCAVQLASANQLSDNALSVSVLLSVSLFLCVCVCCVMLLHPRLAPYAMSPPLVVRVGKAQGVGVAVL